MVRDDSINVELDLVQVVILVASIVFLLTLIGMDCMPAVDHCLSNQERAAAAIALDYSNPNTPIDCRP